MEKTAQTNAGIDIGLFKNRINFEIDYYHKKTPDILLNAPIPASSGYSSIVKNIGSMQNKGFEFTLNTVNMATQDSSWEKHSTFHSTRIKLPYLEIIIHFKSRQIIF